jgi:adenosylcobinamide-GDP ribazoletransferase
MIKMLNLAPLFEDFFEALRFLTIFKVPSQTRWSENALARSMIFFPSVGLMIAGLSLALFSVAENFFPHRIATLVLLIAPIVISGGLHVDGFADFCDGFFGGKERADILRIMKDSRVGAWGALGVALLMLTKFELLLAIPQQGIVFVGALVASRWAQVVLSAALPYAGLGEGISELVAKKTSAREVLGATLFLMPFLFLIPNGFLILSSCVFFLFALGSFFKKKVGGITGDLFGAASELTEVFILLASTFGARS